MEPQPLSAHLEELRKRLLRSVVVIAGATAGTFAVAPTLFRWLLRPYHAFLSDPQGAAMLQTLQPAETFKMSFQLALVVGLALVLPYLLYEIWSFVRPGLTIKERRWLRPILGGGALLFCAGVLFAYYLVLPIALHFFWDYSLRLGITPGWTVGHYVSFVLSTLGAFGCAFELPLVACFLAACGLVTPQWLRSQRRYAYFLLACCAALLTPPDALSMLLMGLPLLGLYELSILCARAVTIRT